MRRREHRIETASKEDKMTPKRRCTVRGNGDADAVHPTEIEVVRGGSVIQRLPAVEVPLEYPDMP